MVDRILQTPATAGVTALRFDFRCSGDGGPGEQRDVVAGVDPVAAELELELPVWLVDGDPALGLGFETTRGSALHLGRCVEGMMDGDWVSEEQR